MEQSFKIETGFGGKLIPTIRISNGRQDFHPDDLEGKTVYNKSQDVTGVFRSLGSRSDGRGGHGEPEWFTEEYVLITGKYEIKRISEGNILILKHNKI